MVVSYRLGIVSWVSTLFIVPALAIGCKSTTSPPPIDIRDSVGVQTDKLPGSRVEYFPFPAGYKIDPGHSLELEFRTSSPSGLIFLTGDFVKEHMVSAYLHKGLLTFARRCDSGRAFEIYREKLDDNRWHKLTYYHSENGGMLFVDDVKAYRHYHLGPCASFTSVIFGGISGPIAAEMSLNPVVSGYSTSRESEAAARHRFQGCLRNLRFDGKIPIISPHYYTVSQCDVI